jgi:hypothetical protein
MFISVAQKDLCYLELEVYLSENWLI